MKTKRRHELQTNQLADTLAHGIEVVKPYTRVVLGLSLAVVVLGLTYLYLSGQSSAKQDRAWDDYIEAMMRDPSGMGPDLKKLSALAEKPAEIHASEWAKLALADIALTEGNELLYADKTQATQQLRRAVEIYEVALNGAQDPLLKQHALFGLARANESLGEMVEAQKVYAQLLEEFPDGPYAREAKRRQDDLNKPSTKEFYEWFIDYNPEKEAAKLTGKPGEKPDFTGDPLEKDFKASSDFDPFRNRSPAEKKDSPTAPEESVPEEPKSTTEDDEATSGKADAPDAKSEAKPAASGASEQDDAKTTSDGKEK
jgi:tetratricopeptide (TPR) repeat protein